MKHEDPRISIAWEQLNSASDDSWLGFVGASEVTELRKEFTGMPRNKTFDDLMESIKELHSRKNHDYAADGNPYGNFEFAANLVRDYNDPVDQVFAGIIGIKLARLGQLLGTGKTPNHESVQDTMRDLTTYCGIWTSRYIDNQLNAPERFDSPFRTGQEESQSEST